MSSGFNLPGATVLAANLWWYSYAVVRPARLFKPYRPFRTADLGTRPKPDGRAVRGKHFHTRYRDPVLLESKPADYASVEDFDALATTYQRVMEPFSEPVFEEVMEILQPFFTPQSRILDPSCGPGLELIKLAARVPRGEVVGADLAGEMVKIAARNADARGVRNAAFFQADVARMPKQFAGRFDIVYCAFAFHHYPDPPAALRDLRRVLRKGGHACIVDAGPWWMKTLASPLCRWGDPGWVGFHTGQEFQRLFLDAGFSHYYWTEVVPGIGLSIGTR